MNRLYCTMLAALSLLLPITALAADNEWSGTGPFATGLGNRVITALVVSSDGKKVYSGSASGTVFSYAYTAPGVTTGAASVVSAGAATLDGTVNANNADAAVSFEYGLTTAYGASVAASPMVATGTSSSSVIAGLSGLLAGTTYHYRITAINSGGRNNGTDQTFTTWLAPAFTSGSATSFTYNNAGSFAVTASGIPAPAFATVSALPAGVALNSNGILSGTPTETGTFPLAITATNSAGSASQNLTVTITKIPQVIGTISFSPATLAVNGSTTASASGGASGQPVVFTSTTPLVCSVLGATVSALTPGTCTVAADQAAAASYSAATRVTRNIVVPEITGPTLIISALGNAGLTNNATLNVSGTASDSGSGVKSVTVNGLPAAVAGDGSFSAAITLADGPNTITTIAIDNADNSTTDSRNITLDRTVPGLTITLPADNGVTGKTFVEISGTVDDPTAAVAVKVNDGSATSAIMNGANFGATVNLVSGLNTIDISVTDQAGNSTSAKRTVKSDTAVPTLAVNAPAQDISTTQASVTVSGSVSDSITSATVSITVDGQSFAQTIAADGSFSQNITLAADKTYAVIVTAIDQAGNTATVQRNIIKTAAEPTGGNLPPAPVPVVNTPVIVAGDVNGDGAVDIADALRVLLIAVGVNSATTGDYAKADVAPLKDGKPSPDGIINIADAVVILQKSVGLRNW